MNILHTIAGLWEGTGGPSASVGSLCSGLADKGHRVTLLTGVGNLDGVLRAAHQALRPRLVRLGPYRLARWSPAFRAACFEEGRQADIIHDHGVWLHTNWSSVRAGVRLGRPVVRSPRGMLSPWALGRSRVTKGLLWSLVERRLFEKASLIHVTSETEERDVTTLGLSAPSVVIPNGVDLVETYAWGRVARARTQGTPEAAGQRIVLFLSRIHPIKGLKLLCRVWAELPAHTPALLLIAGPGQDAELARLRAWVGSQPGPPARYIGPVSGDKKLELLTSAWVLVLPSHSENYGMVVAEALACGTPVVTTTEMPWGDVAREECGWVVAPRCDELARVLREALGMSEDAQGTMGVRARALVERSHSLEQTVARMETAYMEVLEHGRSRIEDRS